jgi:hypothetical protein
MWSPWTVLNFDERPSPIVNVAYVNIMLNY